MKAWIAALLALVCCTGSMGMAEIREMTLASQGQALYCKTWLPDPLGRRPLVVLAHGLGVNHATCADYARALSEYGIAAVCVDFRGGGEGSRSEGAMADMSFDTEIADLEAVLGAIPTWDFADGNRVALMGLSQGGLVAALTAARHPDAAAALVLLFPAFNLPDLVRKRCPADGTIPESMELGDVTVGRAYVECAADCDPLQEIAGFDKPVLLLHGSRDHVVPLRWSRLAQEVCADAEFTIVKGGGHGFAGAQFDFAMDAILAFLTGHGFDPDN